MKESEIESEGQGSELRRESRKFGVRRSAHFRVPFAKWPGVAGRQAGR